MKRNENKIRLLRKIKIVGKFKDTSNIKLVIVQQFLWVSLIVVVSLKVANDVDICRVYIMLL